MQTYELLVEGRSVRANSYDTTLVRTSVGIDQVHVLFDSDEWLSFPLTITFAQDGVEPVTSSITVSAISGSSEYLAEATVTIPYEVITMVGPIRVTLQGTDSDGNHIITAYGAPLSVEEAGDVTIGEVPADAPTVDQWTQAYNNAQTAINDVQTLINTLQSQLDSMVSAVQTDLSEQVDAVYTPATTDMLGVIKVGNGLNVSDDGTLNVVSTTGITANEQMQIANVASLAYYCFDTEFDSNGYVKDNAKIKVSALPLSSMVDGTSIVVNDDGLLSVGYPDASEVGY